MPPSVTSTTVPANVPVNLPASTSWWVMLGTLTSLLLAGHTLRPRALAQAQATTSSPPALAARPPQSPPAAPRLLRVGSLATRTVSKPTSL